MASRAILRRRRFLSDYLNASTYSIQTSQCIGHATQNLDSRDYSSIADCPFAKSNSVRKLEKSYVEKEEMVGFSRLGYIMHKCPGIPFMGLEYGRSEVISPTGQRLLPTRNASTATAKQPESDDEDNEELVARKKKEASPEECDRAIEDLNSAKAKAKTKRLQESEKVATSILQRVWAMLVGIVPAVRYVACMSREDWAKKLAYWKHEFLLTLQHYWLGFKLLWADVRISSRLLLKLAGGKSLSRRERQQLTRTTADIFRLVPFGVFIIVPFMEFLLPVFLKLFPNMLPSTFQDKMKEEEELKRKLQARIEYAKFLQNTVKEMAKEVKNSRSGEIKKTAEDLDEFLNRVRKGAGVSNEEILGFAKLFNDELTLDNISRPRLVNMCKYMGINPFGTDAYLRYMLRKTLQRIKDDDKMIQAEGVESLSEGELREDCRERGMLGLLSVEEMRQQLRDWLDLSLNHSVPSSLLILSRPEEAVQATLSSLPDEVVDTVGVTALPSEDPVSERRRKLEYLELQEELIKEEGEKEEEELERMKESKSNEVDVALQEMTPPPTAREAQEQARARTSDKQEQLCELSRALAVLASASSVSIEREEFMRLVEEEMEFYNRMVEQEDVDGEKDALEAYRAAREKNDHADNVSSVLMEKVDAMVQNLKKEINDVEQKIGENWRVLDRDEDGKVTPEEVAAAAMCLKITLCKEGVQELISNLPKDRDGKILVEDIIKLGSHTEDYNTVEEGAN